MIFAALAVALVATGIGVPPLDVDLTASGQNATNLAQIRAVEAHQYATGKNVLVAVIDTGINLEHPHFAGVSITTHNAVDGSTDVAEACVHGTAVTGVLVDVAPDVDVLAIKIYADTCYAAYSALARGIVYAADAGARIIQIATGGSSDTFVVAEAVAYAHDKGALVIAAAGNQANGAPFYPAFYPTVMAVAGVDGSDALYERSNYGSYIAIAAPAVGIEAPYGLAYVRLSGTSMAAPHVAGVAALLLELQPTLTVAELRDLLTLTAVDLGDVGRDDHYGSGRVDALAAVDALLPAGSGTAGAQNRLPWIER